MPNVQVSKVASMTSESELLNLLTELPAPDDYYTGRHIAPTVAAPNNILLFHRKKLIGGDAIDAAHHRYSLVYCIHTTASIGVNERSITVPAGHATLMTPHQFHSFILPTKPINWLFITFELQDDEKWLSPLQNQVFPIRQFSQELLSKLVRTYLEPPDDTRSRILPHMLGYWLAHLLETKALPLIEEGQTKAAYRPAELMEQINQYINLNLKKDLSVKALAEEVGISESNLRATVSKVLGFGLGSYVNRIRMNRAQGLITGTDMSIKEIAYECGFNSSQSFARAFRRATGSPPSNTGNLHSTKARMHKAPCGCCTVSAWSLVKMRSVQL